jgi:hypothetical protein
MRIRAVCHFGTRGGAECLGPELEVEQMLQNGMNNARTTERRESDLGVAAYLVVKGFSVLGLEPAAGRRLNFRFDNEGGAADAAALAYMHDDCVSARQLVGAMKDLKTMLYSKNGNGNCNEAEHNFEARR